MVTSILEWGHPGLIAHMLAPKQEGGCDFIGVVTGSAQTVDTVRGPMRAGNLGHVTRMGNKMVAVAAAAASGGGGDGSDAAIVSAAAGPHTSPPCFGTQPQPCSHRFVTETTPTRSTNSMYDALQRT